MAREVLDHERAALARQLRIEMRDALLRSPFFNSMTVDHFKSMVRDVEDCVNKWTDWNKTSQKME